MIWSWISWIWIHDSGGGGGEEKKSISRQPHRHVVCKEKDVNRKRIIRLTVLIQFHDWDRRWLITQHIGQMETNHTGTRNTKYLSLSLQNGEKQTSNLCVVLSLFSMLFLSPGRSCFSPSNHMLISVSMFYSVLAAADDRRRPWADPATQTQTHTKLSLSLYYYTHSQDTQNHFGGTSIKWCTGAIERNPRNGGRQKWCRLISVTKFSLNGGFVYFKKSYRRMSKSLMGEKMVLLQGNVPRFQCSFRATLDTTSLRKRLAHTDAADTGL